MNKKDRKEYLREYYRAHREELNANRKEYFKAYYQAHKEEKKAWEQANREERKAYHKAYYQAHKENSNAYRKSHTNSLGKTKNSVRCMSSYFLFNVLNHTKIDGYEIHHCFGYEDYKKFIYIPRELHLQIHQFLRDNGIDADSNHYSKIEHLIVNYLKFKERHVLVLR